MMFIYTLVGFIIGAATSTAAKSNDRDTIKRQIVVIVGMVIILIGIIVL